MNGLKPGMAIQIWDACGDDCSVFSASTEPNWRGATVVNLLSTQFTADCRGRVVFCFYKDEGSTWQKPEKS